MARSSSPGREEINAAISRRELVLGMAPAHVRVAWGVTSCKFSDSFEGSPTEFWGCGRDAKTRALRPGSVQHCQDVVLIVYSVGGRVAGWASADKGQP